MQLDDILGLFFLLFFVVIPVLRGLFAKGEVVVELEPPPEPEAIPEPKPEAEPKPIPEPEPKPKPYLEPEPRPMVAEPRWREEPKEKAPPPPPPKAKPEAKKAPRERGLLDFERGAILEGIIWHEVLSEPRAKRRWRPKL